MAKHDIKADKTQVNELRASDNEKIIAKSVISYDSEKTLDDHDLVYKKYVDSLFSNFMGGANFLGQFDTLAELEAVPAEDIPEGSFAYVGTGDDFSAYYWDNNAQQWGTDQPSFTNFSADRFYKGNRSSVAADEVLYTKGKKDIVYDQSGNLIISPEFMGNFVFTRSPVNLRGVESVLPEGGQEFTVENRTGAPMTVENGFAGPDNSSFNIGSTMTIPNGGKMAFKSEASKWELGVVNQVAFSDHLDSVNVRKTLKSNGTATLSNILNINSEVLVSLKEHLKDVYGNLITDDDVDNVSIYKMGAKYMADTQILTGTPLSILMYGADPTGLTDSTEAIRAAIRQRVSDWIIIPKGNFKYSGNLTLRDGIRLEGHGFRSILEQTNTDRSGVILGNDNSLHSLALKGNMITDSIPGGSGNGSGIFANGKLNFNITHCKISGFSEAGIQARNCKDGYILNNRFSDNPYGGGNSADICLYSPTEGSRINIIGNLCFSNNSQGIYVGALGSDSICTISGNKCITLDSNGNILENGTGLRRRHGIITGYNGGNYTKLIITDNHLVQTRWAGIYTQGDDSVMGTNLISNNFCIDNGWSSGEPLTGGIFMANTGGKGDIISGNFVLDYRNPATQATMGAIKIAGINGGGFSLIDNVISNSASNGLSLGYQSSLGKIEGNYFIGSANVDIYASNGTGVNNGGHLIKRNTFVRSNSGSPSILIDNPNEVTLKYYVEDNDFIGFSNASTGAATTGTNHNVAICARRFQPMSITDNRVRNYYGGVGVVGYVPSNTRFFDTLIVDRNEFNDCFAGVMASASTATSTSPVCGNLFINCTNRVAKGIATGVGQNCLYVADRMGVNLAIYSTSSPSNGSWLLGDKAFYTNPSATSAVGAVCISTGTPGTWREFGANFQRSELITSSYDLTSPPDGSWIKYNVTGVNKFSGSPDDLQLWNIQQTIANSHTVATRLATNRVTGEVFSQVYTSSAWQPWIPLSSPNASTAQRGIIEQATDAEIKTGTDTERSVDPKGLKDNYISFTERVIASTGTVAITPLTYNIKYETITFTGIGTVTLNGFSDSLSNRALILINKTGNDLTVVDGASVTVPFSGAFVIPNNQSARFQVYSNLILKEL